MPFSPVHLIFMAKRQGKERRALQFALLVFSVALAVIAAGCIGQGQPPDNTASNLADGLPAAALPQRPSYAGVAASAFALLPEYPADFEEKDRRVMALALEPAELALLGEEYYAQPEFYPTWEELGAELFANHPDDKIAIWGLGAYPADQSFDAARDAEFTTAVFFYSSWLVQTYQGIQLSASYNDSAVDVYFEPVEFVLGPNWPAFDRGWVNKVTIRIKPKEAGSHAIALNPVQPSPGAEGVWRERYGGLYVNAPSAAPERPYVQFTVNVE
jgi:hypothetical protein